MNKENHVPFSSLAGQQASFWKGARRLSGIFGFKYELRKCCYRSAPQDPTY